MVKMDVDFNMNSFDLNSNIDKIKAALDYLKSFQDQALLIKDERAFEAFTYLYKVTASFIVNNQDLINLYEEKNLLEIIYTILEHLSTICGDLKNNNQEGFTTLDNHKNTTFWNVVQILNFLNVYSVNLRLKYFEMGGTKALLKILENEKFAENFHNEETFFRVVANINWLSKNADLYKAEWNELNAVDTMLNVSRKYPMSKLIAYMTFANIANDRQIDRLTELPEIISELIKIIIRAANDISEKSITREKHPFIEEDETTSFYDVYIVPVEEYNTKYTVTGVLLALYKLSVNNTIKYDMYIKYNLKEPIKKIISNGSEIEKKHTVQLLAQLCFDNQVLDLVSRDEGLKICIEKLSKPENCTMKTMMKLCEQISWGITIKNKTVEKEVKKINQQTQVMISYNSGSRDLCLKIKDELEKNGFKIWIDVNEIHGSSLESMAKAVESSDFILMCVTEKYRQSVNCQAEAQYAFKLKKKIIPLIMQKGYENVDGWLGIIMGDKIFVNFIKFPFEKCVSLILHEINAALKSVTKMNSESTHVESKPNNNTPNFASTQIHSSNVSNILKWSESQVENWFNEKNIVQTIVNIIKPCDGELLHQLYTLQISAPEFFYQSITKNNSVDLRTALVFALHLKKLFEQ